MDKVTQRAGFSRSTPESQKLKYSARGFRNRKRFRNAIYFHHPAEDERYCSPPAPLPDTPATRRDTADFKAAARDGRRVRSRAARAG